MDEAAAGYCEIAEGCRRRLHVRRGAWQGLFQSADFSWDRSPAVTMTAPATLRANSVDDPLKKSCRNSQAVIVRRDDYSICSRTLRLLIKA